MRICTAIIIVLLLVPPMLSAGTTRDIILHLTPAPSAWSSQNLQEKVIERLTRQRNWRVRLAQEQEPDFPGAPATNWNADNLMDWGSEIGGRYLLIIKVQSERLERRKTFSIPLIFHRWEVFGVIVAEIRLFDIKHRRVLLAEPIKIELKGPRIFQAHPDADRYDADIHITAPDKIAFFDRLERRFAAAINNRIRMATKNSQLQSSSVHALE